MKEKIFQILIEADLVDPKYEECVLFGLGQIKYLFSNALIILLLGVVFDEVTSSICFLFAFAILRSYAGGYHSSTVLRCYVISTVIVIIVMCLFKLHFWSRESTLVAILLSGAILYVLVPVDNKNHRLNHNEKKYFRKKAYFILNMEIVLGLFGLIFQLTYIYKGITAAMIITLALVCLGYIRNIDSRRN